MLMMIERLSVTFEGSLSWRYAVFFLLLLFLSYQCLPVRDFRPPFLSPPLALQRMVVLHTNDAHVVLFLYLFFYNSNSWSVCLYFLSLSLKSVVAGLFCCDVSAKPH